MNNKSPVNEAFNVKTFAAKTGNKPSTGQCIGRHFAYFISMLPLMPGIIWAAFDKKKQGWHDKISGPLVVKG